jgi:hypothetical protein
MTARPEPRTHFAARIETLLATAMPLNAIRLLTLAPVRSLIVASRCRCTEKPRKAML